MLGVIRAVILRYWSGTVRRGKCFPQGATRREGSAHGANIWVLVSMLLFKHSGAFNTAHLDYLGTWAGASKVDKQTALQCASKLISLVSARSIPQLLPSAENIIGHFLWWERICQHPAAWRSIGWVLLCCWRVRSLGICCVVTRPEIHSHCMTLMGELRNPSLSPSLLPQGICSYLRNWEAWTQKLECYFMLPLYPIV